MSTPSFTGVSVQPQSEEETVLIDYWLSYLKNMAHQCITRLHLPSYQGDKYTAEDFWTILIVHCLMNLSLEEATNRINDFLWQDKLRHQRRKTSPKKLGGRGDRTERMTPNGDQVRKYRNSLPKYLLDNLNQFIFEVQLDYALEHKLITKEVEVLVDNTDEWYYGSDRYPDNPFITKGHNGPGTNRKRKYLALMLKSGSVYLFCGVDLIRKHGSNVPFIIKTLDWLIQKGLTIKYVLGDRWFPTYELLSELDVRGINYIGPYKKYPKIKKLIINYLQNGGNYIHSYDIQGAPANFYHSPNIPVTLIFTNRRGKRLREIREEHLASGKPAKEFLNEIMVMMTTIKPPKGKKARQGWAVQICHMYDSRWNIETGFRDLNRESPPSNARTNTRKFFMFTVRLWVFNAWHLSRAKYRKKLTKWKSQKRGPTLRQFSYRLMRLEGLVLTF